MGCSHIKELIFALSGFACFACSVAFIITIPIYSEKYYKLKDYEQGLCYSDNCKIGEGLECEENKCWSIFILYCQYTVIEPLKYQNFSQRIKAYKNSESINVENEFANYENTTQTCYVNSNDIKKHDPEAQYYYDVIIWFAVSYIVLLVFTFAQCYWGYRQQNQEKEKLLIIDVERNNYGNGYVIQQ